MFVCMQNKIKILINFIHSQICAHCDLIVCTRTVNIKFFDKFDVIFKAHYCCTAELLADIHGIHRLHICKFMAVERNQNLAVTFALSFADKNITRHR